MKERNIYIDVIRGLAVLNVVVMHTAFWAGMNITPTWFKSLTLCIDMPLFVFLSGWAMSLRPISIGRAYKGLGRIWLQWVFFISLVALICFVSLFTGYKLTGPSGLASLIHAYFFDPDIPSFILIAGSVWFMPYYFLTIFLNVIVVRLIEKTDDSAGNKSIYLFVLLGIFAWICMGQYFFNVDKTVIFFSFFWMLGQNKDRFAGLIDKFWKLVVFEICMCAGVYTASRAEGLSVMDMQSAKFPTSLTYAFYSMITLAFFVYIEKKIKYNSKFLSHIGRNAIFFYFGQCVGGSLLFVFRDHMNLMGYWLVVWFIMLLFNLAVSLASSEILRVLYGFVKRGIYRIGVNTQ